MADGTVWTAGHNYNGEVGDSTTQPRRYRVSVLSGATSVAVGYRHTLAAAGGTAYAWGRGIDGQLCDDLAIAHHLPTPIPGLTGVVQVAAANFSSFFVLADGTVRSCGGNENGILADGTETARHLPVSVAGITDASAIAAGPEHVLVLRATGTVLAWGKNTHGRLGDGTTTDRQAPVAVSGLTNVVAVAAGRDFSMAVDASGQVWVWGLGFYGISGDGTTSDHLTPFQVPGLTDVTQIAAGRFHAAVVDGNQQVRTWGGGLLGHGSTQWLSVPTVVAGLQPIAMVAAGGDSTFAFAVDGGVYGWGDNAHGLLGDGTDAVRLSPIVLADGGGVWRTGTPVFGPSGGTYATEQTVQITSATPGAVVRYTTTGSDPTESDPQVPIGGLLVDQNRTLKARAWTAGREPSYVAAATFTLQPASPAVAPGTGSYTASQTVTMATSTPGAVIRYTLDGSVPTASSPPYGGPVAISTGTTLSAKAFKAGWAESALRIATYSFNYGTLGTPVLSPGGGTYGADHSGATAGGTWATDRPRRARSRFG